MSLPLRHPLDTAASLDRVLEDLIVRFIINCPPEDFSSVERELFHVEEATWFYTDFVKILNPNLPNMKIKSFAQQVIKLCPMVWKWDVRAEQALQKFSQYKRSIPVRGAAIFNKKMSKLLLVKGTESDSWSFPRGKISKDENDVDCCVREVLEEIGFDITDYIDEEQFIERTIGGKNYKIFLVSGVPEDFKFEPQVRNEIEKIQWHDFKKLSKSCNSKTSHIKIYLVNNLMRPLTMWAKSHRQIDDDEKLKAHVETQLKLLLGIKKEDTPDPGRELLNMLQNTVSAGSTATQNPNSGQPITAENGLTSAAAESTHAAIPAPTFVAPPPQFQNNFPFMAFQPFAPFPFMNGNSHQIGTAPVPDSSSSGSEYTQPPPTPNMNTLAKPTVVEEDEQQELERGQGGDSNPQLASSKQLLDLLNKKALDAAATKQAQSPTQQRNVAFQHGESIQTSPANSESTAKSLLDILKKPHEASQSDNTNLLNMIKKPAKINIASPVISNRGLVSNPSSPATEGSEYEDFESSSEGDHDENVVDPLELFSDRYDTEKINQRYEQRAPLESEAGHALPASFIEVSRTPSGNPENKHAGLSYSKTKKDSTPNSRSVNADVEHSGVSSVGEESTTATQDNQGPKSQVKPKFKLLKRGEILANISEPTKPEVVANLSPDFSEPLHREEPNILLSMLKKPSKPTSSHVTEDSSVTIGNIPAVEAITISKSSEKKGTVEMTSSNEDSKSLLGLLKQSETANETEVNHNGENKAAAELLDMLHGHSYRNSSTNTEKYMPGLEVQIQHSFHGQSPLPGVKADEQSSCSPNQTYEVPIAKNQSASQELLGMLKKPKA